jgi:ABC-type branched-subunit amino acid transport system substrate-binding protein
MTGPDDPEDTLGRGSRLNPIRDPGSPAGQLAQALRDLVAGEPLRQFAPRVPCALATLSDALSGDPRRVPGPRIIEGICNVRGADKPNLTRLLALRTEAIKSRPPDDPAQNDSGAPEGPAQTDSAVPEGTAPNSSRLGPVLRGRRVPVAVFVVVIGLVVVGVVGWWLWWPHECGGPFSGIRLNDKTDRECIGITDGSYLFNDPSKASNGSDRKIIEGINGVEQRIENENRDVAGADRYVKVVLLMPLTVSQDKDTLSTISLKEILHSLEGSYTALYRVNHSRDFGDPSAVKIQLLLANQGSRQDADPDFLDGIVKASQQGHPVVSVIGLGSSLPNTNTAVEYLAKQGLPMVSAATSGDSLKNPLLWIVSPSNMEYVNRINSFLGTKRDVLKSGIIVYDLNPDLFTRSLAQDYRTQLGNPYVKFPDQGFLGGTTRSPAQPDVFFPVVTNLCNAANDPSNPLDMVLYAGRVADLGAFTEALKARTCRNRPLTVVTATTGFAVLRESVQGILPGSNVMVIVATSSDSSSWGGNLTGPGTPPGYAAFLAAYQATRFGDESDSLDGYAISHHDALATAAKAINLAAEARPTQAPNPEDVAVQLGNLNLSNAVPAASGTLSFRPEGSRASRAPDQSIPIKQIG